MNPFSNKSSCSFDISDFGFIATSSTSISSSNSLLVPFFWGFAGLATTDFPELRAFVLLFELCVFFVLGGDLVFVAAAGNPAAYENLALFKYLKILNSKRVALGGISGGPVLLAKAGVMENRRFTVHWDHRDALREISSDLLIERNIYVIDRDRYTCAGGIAPMDMMSALIASDHGSDLAKAVNDWYIYTSVRDSSQPQRASLVEKYNVHHPAILSALELMQNHIADPLSTTQLADLSNIGERQLVRLFQAQLGKGPNRFYRDLRMEHARVLVQQSALSIVEIAVACGFEGASYFSQIFKENFGVTPTEMRKEK